ncbi:cell filamentation protein Fic [Actinomyces gaoshouyii]|uniref:cell filamentation protein Fic n=1 Tax=Actinomyces gaoshouyii TaxID=1960083 RepID=UPI0009B4FEA7
MITMGASIGRSSGASGGRPGGSAVPGGIGGARLAGGTGAPARIAPGAGVSGAGAGGADRALVSALAAIAQDARVSQAQEAVREASAQLRWHEALRRRWREARAEAVIRGAIASGAIEGALVSASALREHVVAGRLERPLSGDPSLDAVAGIWRAGVRLTGFMPDLRGQARPAEPSPRSLLAGLHRDLAGPLAASGAIGLDEVAVPRTALPPGGGGIGGGTEGAKGGDGVAGARSSGGTVGSVALGAVPREGGPGTAPRGRALAERLDALLAIIAAPGVPALVRAAVVHGEMITARPFTAANAALGRLLVRHLIARDGLEPTGVAVPDAYARRAPGAYSDAAAAYARGDAEGVIAWTIWQAEAILVGITQGVELCRAIQAGRAE